MGVALSLVKVQFAGTIYTWHFFEDTTYTTWTQPVTSHQSKPTTPPHFSFLLSLFRRRFLGARNCITASTSTHGSRGGAGSTSNQPLRSLEAFRHMADLDLCWSRRRNNAIFGRRGTLTRQNELKWKKWNFKLSWCLCLVLFSLIWFKEYFAHIVFENQTNMIL